MRLNLPSNRTEFASFPDLYDREIGPYLVNNEGLRKRAVRNGFMFGALVLAVGIIIEFIVPSSMKMFPIFIGIAGCIGTVSLHLGKARHIITEGLIGKITDQLGFNYQRKLERPEYFEPFQQLKFFSSFNREHWEDEVRGSHNGQKFIICESDLKYKTSGKNSSTRTIFHGQLLVIDYTKRFLGKTVLRRDAGLMNRFGKPGKEFQHVGLASAEFEKAYEAWSTDQVEARELLDPIVLERFQELERLFQGKGLQAAFADGKLMIAIETGDRLNIGSMFKPLEGKGRVETILKEFDVIFDLMDVALKPVEKRLSGALSVDQL